MTEYPCCAHCNPRHPAHRLPHARPCATCQTARRGTSPYVGRTYAVGGSYVALCDRGTCRWSSPPVKLRSHALTLLDDHEQHTHTPRLVVVT